MTGRVGEREAKLTIRRCQGDTLASPDVIYLTGQRAGRLKCSPARAMAECKSGPKHPLAEIAELFFEEAAKLTARPRAGIV